MNSLVMAMPVIIIMGKLLSIITDERNLIITIDLIQMVDSRVFSF